MRYGFRSVRRSDKEALLLKVILTNLCFDLQQFHKTIKTLCFLNFTFNFLSQKSSDDSFQPSLPSVANKIDATRKPLESLAVFAFSGQVFSFNFHRCQIDTRWIRTTEVSFRGLVPLIFQRNQPSFSFSKEPFISTLSNSDFSGCSYPIAGDGFPVPMVQRSGR